MVKKDDRFSFFFIVYNSQCRVVGRGSSQCMPPTGSWAPPCGQKARWRPYGCRPWSRRTPPSLWTQIWRRAGEKVWTHRDGSSRIQINSLPEIITTGWSRRLVQSTSFPHTQLASYRNTLWRTNTLSNSLSNRLNQSQAVWHTDIQTPTYCREGPELRLLLLCGGCAMFVTPVMGLYHLHRMCFYQLGLNVPEA